MYCFSLFYSNVVRWFFTIRFWIDQNEWKRIGLFTGADSYQYPVLAKYWDCKQVENVRLEAMASNQTHIEFVPDVFLVADIGMDAQRSYYYGDVEYRCAYAEDDYSLWCIYPH